VSPDELKAKLEPWLAGVSRAESVSIIDMEKLSGGAIQENWFVNAGFSSGPATGIQKLVIRTDAPASVSTSHSRSQEFILLQQAFKAGVRVPEPLWCCDDLEVLGRSFFVMRRVAGVAAGFKITKDSSLGGDRRQLLKNLGRELARIHTITPPNDALSFLSVPDVDPAARDIAQYRRYLDEFNTPRPILEWGLSWLEINAPKSQELVLTHQDYRTGNYMVDQDGVTGILDWEFANWGDPICDIGWFCAKCWRFGANANEAGGIGERLDFYQAYQEQSGRTIDPVTVRYWEVMAHVRWAIIAIQQGDRFVVDGEENLEAALTAYVVPELEYEIICMTEQGT
jgi:aminoglycoside phosphotransferase (APT) family kinase protein